ncbi:myb-like protein X-like [Dorcoceras hygrometricum]|uniref:Myb-like protein X-like n=1 Tax=Dorcoceras hygrometricum TaxID=472368 RepID=A0A2Z7BSH3_9LAMI|nr:myb-like protein X-like [Dorcoceras hygrometricum]
MNKLGLRDEGIDQLNFHSAQLGYLKLLQMGTQTQQDKAGNKYEVKPQYEELSKQINMQHTINQCYECMRLSRNRIARPVYQLATQIKPLYHTHEGIDQLNFHSAQLGYLKLLQMGTQTQQDKAGNKYEVKPQYEELSKQINMQHTINQCYECMRLSRTSLGGRHSNPVVHTPTIALDLSGTTQQPASHNMAPNQKLKLVNSAVSRSRSSSTQPPRLVGKERSSQEVSNATKNSKNGGRDQRQFAIESDGEQ